MSTLQINRYKAKRDLIHAVNASKPFGLFLLQPLHLQLLFLLQPPHLQLLWQLSQLPSIFAWLQMHPSKLDDAPAQIVAAAWGHSGYRFFFVLSYGGLIS